MSRRPGIGALVGALWLAGAAGITAGVLWLAPRNGAASMIADQGLASLLLMAAFLTVGVVGAVVAWKRPRNAVGWVFLAVFVLIGVLVYAQEHATYALGVAPGALPGGVLAAWVSRWAWYPAVGLVFVFVPLLFPTGRPPTRRWRVVGWAGGLALAAVTAHSALAERLQDHTYSVANPIGIPGVVAEQGPVDAVAGAVLLAAVVGAVASLVVRFRRARGDERQQLKWFTFAAALLPLLLVVDLVGSPLPDVVGDITFAVLIALLPLAAGLAMLRYRLYEVDRIISRTVSYGLLTAVLAGVYVAGVVLFGRLLAPVTPGSDVAVAASTLAAAAVFAPARRRIQAGVDRRFNRARYDAEREVRAFRARLRDEVDLEQLQRALLATVDGTVQPAAAWLWVRGAPAEAVHDGSVTLPGRTSATTATTVKR